MKTLKASELRPGMIIETPTSKAEVINQFKHLSGDIRKIELKFANVDTSFITYVSKDMEYQVIEEPINDAIEEFIDDDVLVDTEIVMPPAKNVKTYNLVENEDPIVGIISDGSGFVTKDSGARQEFASGAVRDTQDGKPRYDLIPPAPMKRLAEVYARGAVKYGDSNWTKGMETNRMLASAMRHLEQYRLGETDEDHLAAVVFNLFGIMHFQGTKYDNQFDWFGGIE